jgi:chaperonin GroEL (HSP60 family)
LGGPPPMNVSDEGVQMMREVVSKTDRVAGDERTTAAFLEQRRDITHPLVPHNII